MAVHPTTRLQQVDVQALDPAQLEPLIGSERMARFEATAARRAARPGRAHRAERQLHRARRRRRRDAPDAARLRARASGIDARWVVIEGDPAFFAITKRIHNQLYGSPGDGGPLGAAERAALRGDPARATPSELLALVRRRRRRDPARPADRRPGRGRAGAPARTVVWRCHVGRDAPNECDRARVGVPAALPRARPTPSCSPAPRSRRRGSTAPRCHVIPPSIDPFSAKNEPMSAPRRARRSCGYVGLLGGDGELPAVPFRRRDGSPGRIDRRVDILQTGPPPPPRRAARRPGLALGPHEGHGRRACRASPSTSTRSLGAHLVLAGPAVTGVADDPEAAEVLDDCVARWRALPHATRSRVHLACVPMHDPDEAAAIVNALQRHATVVVQKSLAEGFGLTVAEAMWKQRPVVASAVGGIVDQIERRRARACCSTTRTTSPASARRSSGSCATRPRRRGMGANARGARPRSSSATATSSSTPSCSRDWPEGRRAADPNPRARRPGRRHGGRAAVRRRVPRGPPRPGVPELRLRAHRRAGGGVLPHRRPRRSARTSRSPRPTR